MQIVYNKTRDGYSYCCSRQDSPNIIGYKGASNAEKVEIAKNAIFNPQDNYITTGLEKYIRIDSIVVLGIAEVIAIGNEEWKFVVYGEEALLDYKKDTYSKTRIVKHKITVSAKKSSDKWEVKRFSLPKMTFGRAGDWVVYEGEEYFGTFKKLGAEGVYQKKTKITISESQSSSGSKSSSGGTKKSSGLKKKGSSLRD